MGRGLPSAFLLSYQYLINSVSATEIRKGPNPFAHPPNLSILKSWKVPRNWSVHRAQGMIFFFKTYLFSYLLPPGKALPEPQLGGSKDPQAWVPPSLFFSQLSRL